MEKNQAVSAAVIDDRRALDLLDWLTQFARAVREVDYGSGRKLFAVDVVSFGTVNEILAGLDELEAKQWRNVWGVTRGFDFDYSSLQTHMKGDHGWAVALWSSQGRNVSGWFDRHGRCTFVFEKRHGQWLAVHSHFSLVPPLKI